MHYAMSEFDLFSGPTTCEENARVESAEDDLALEKSVSKQSKRNSK